jgi:hypothetical protein
VINLVTTKKASPRDGLDYFIMRYSFFIAALVLATLFLTQIESYDLFIIIVIFATILLFRFLNLKPNRSLKRQFRKIKRRSIIYVIKSVEKGERLISAKNFKKNPTLVNSEIQSVASKNGKRIVKYQFLIAIGLGLIAFGSRYYFFLFDNYLLSDLWYNDLENMQNLSLQHWFVNDGLMMGQTAVISFYSDITGITDAVALTSFGLIEASLLTVSLFWCVNKLMGNTIASGIVAALSFMFLYPFLPLNINLMTQPKSAFLAMSIALPYLVYLLIPFGSPTKSRRYFITLLVLALSIFFIDLFIALFFLPVTLLVVSCYNWQYHKKKVLQSLASYAIAMLIGFLILGIASMVQDQSLMTYVYTNLYMYSTYTYAPQLVLPLEELMALYQIAAVTLVMVTHILLLRNKSYKSLAALSLIISVFFLAPLFNLFFVDADILNQLLSVCIPILFAAWVYSIYAITVVSLKKDPLHLNGKLIIVVAGFAGFIWLTTGNSLIDYPQKNQVNTDIVKAYDRMKSDLLPYSYAVVHNDKNSKLSELRHYFLDYRAFNDMYLKQDLEYQNHSKDLNYLKKHPEIVLPQSTFVFIYQDDPTMNVKNDLNKEDQLKTINCLNVLRQRGREINIYFKTSRMTVYEIVNQPKASRIKDLLI